MAYLQLPASSTEAMVIHDAVDMLLGIETKTFVIKEDAWRVRDDVVAWARWAHVSSGAMVNALEALAKKAQAVSSLRMKSKGTILAARIADFVIERIEKPAIDFRAEGVGSLLNLSTIMSASFREAGELLRILDQDLSEVATCSALEGASYANFLSSAFREVSDAYFRKLEIALQGYDSPPSRHSILSHQVHTRLLRVCRFLERPSLLEEEAASPHLADLWSGLDASENDTFFLVKRTQLAPPALLSLPKKNFTINDDNELPGYLRPPPPPASTLFTVELRDGRCRLSKPNFASPLDDTEEENTPPPSPKPQRGPSELFGPWPMQSKLLNHQLAACLDAAEFRALKIYQSHCDKLRSLHMKIFAAEIQDSFEEDFDDNFFLGDKGIKPTYEQAHEVSLSVAAAKTSLADWKGEKKLSASIDHELDVRETAIARLIDLTAQSLERDTAAALQQLDAGLNAARTLDDAIIAHRHYIQHAPGLAGLAFADTDLAQSQALAREHLLAALAHAVAFLDARRSIQNNCLPSDPPLAHYHAFHARANHLISQLDSIIDSSLGDLHLTDALALFRELLAWDRSFFSRQPQRRRRRRRLSR